jgi:ribosome-associated protein
VVTTRLSRDPSDVAAAIEVWKTARGAQGRRPNNEVVERVTAKAASGLLVVALDADRYVGLALGEEAHDDPELLHLEMVIVHPDAQGHGLGGVLVEAIADVAWERGFRRAEVWCTAPGFYEACGFSRSGLTRDDGNVHLTAELEAPVRDVVVTGEIRLGQFLKLASLVETGAEGKDLIAAGEVLVNGEVEERRGRQLTDGDVVQARERSVRVVTKAVPQAPEARSEDTSGT